ncbi:DUF4129 domain-containing protein [Hymenobacter koreensis]|uniref:Protein-glutamine gamma-glutamyltransferase-like C-terminal domain-containing protein n=1 Tax=Hymenobacter koreensis TaxID=1084523 RepID=A0ABP8IVQ9_9BACT
MKKASIKRRAFTSRSRLVGLVLCGAAFTCTVVAAPQPTAVRQPPAVRKLPPPLTPTDSVGSRRPKAEAAPVILPTDRSTPVQLRRPEPERLQAYRAQSAFRYVEPRHKPRGAWDLFWWRFGQWWSSLFDGPGYDRWGRYTVYGAFGLALLYALMRLLRLDLTGALGRAPRTVPLAYDTAPEDIHADDLLPRLTEAETTGNFRVAVRLGYLLVLRSLAERHLVQWQPEKTNHDYVHELAGTPWQQGFATLTRQFEYAWYGEQPLTAAQYAAVRETRHAFERHFSPASARA